VEQGLQVRVGKRLRGALLAAVVALCLVIALPPSTTPPAPVPAHAAACEGDECQPPAPPPDDPVPGTAVAEGPPDPPVTFPKERHKRPRHRGKHRKHR
jgi:hypothetical protein